MINHSEQIEIHPFLHSQGSLPRSLPKSTLACPPSANYMRKYITNYSACLDFDSDKNPLYQNALHTKAEPRKVVNDKLNKKFLEPKVSKHNKNGQENMDPRDSIDSAAYLAEVLHSPETAHLVKFNDYSGKYGVGYSLSNGSRGMLFNDRSGMIQKYRSE